MWAVVLLVVVVGLSRAVEWMVESSLVGLPLWLGLGFVDVVARRAWHLHPKKALRRCRQLVDTVVVVVVPTAPGCRRHSAMGESSLKPLPLLSSFEPRGQLPPDETPYSVPPVRGSSG